ncbi:MAG: Hsp20/alpha crystallin family protein [Deltaproteobacteria bacterium]|nr:MAG: Hsp20/alpha crystallin family protein [Deltaproteobacteria bacterium]
MWMTWNDFDRHFAAIDTLRRELERSVGGTRQSRRLGRWPEATLVDEGERFVFAVDVPGLTQDDLTIDVHNSTLTVAARRVVNPPEGYATHRSERTGFEWKKSFTLPAKIDGERTAANLEEGVLTISLSKLPEAQPRRISIA